ncbi:uncharacterized protein EI97DRAFT_446900 [Westerdykella ornata]|uniref:HAD-like protein n=1 Tax=Westerdykella ornata TaxID=318751 RepID=A0A6A6JVQ4_WESOR|nr:uncharacterized protein EI97DRAFT_446900 [Westerdykella ornata]KAF2280682.1 hypothetical protein EI97DRAFT_446900 [Westerdykella ornata]
MPKPRIDPAHAIHWIVDWDGTLTTRDTLDALVHVASRAKSETAVLEAWRRITSAYLSDHASTLKALFPNGTLPSTVVAERSLLEKLKAVERRSLDRVIQAGLFKDLNTSIMEKGGSECVKGGEVRIRTGASECLRHIRKRIERHGYDLDAIDVLSANWSQYFILGCLKATLDDAGLQGSVAGTDESLPFVSIYANELVFSNSATQDSSHQLLSSADKLAYLQNLRLSNPYTMRPIPVVYIGDSWTDFESLLAADLGICIRDDPLGSSQATLKDSFERLSIECPHITEWEKCGEWSVVWARGFDEILKWVKECLDG